MNIQEWLFVALFIGSVVVLSPLLGVYIARVFDDKRPPRIPGLSGMERLIYRLCRIDPAEPMSWKRYTASLLLFSGFGILFVLVIQLVQNRLPFNPQHLGPAPFLIALNTAVSFATNTDWQAYAGETVMSYGTQMLALTVQNFVSAAAGIAVVAALAPGLSARPRRPSATSGPTSSRQPSISCCRSHSSSRSSSCSRERSRPSPAP